MGDRRASQDEQPSSAGAPIIDATMPRPPPAAPSPVPSITVTHHGPEESAGGGDSKGKDAAEEKEKLLGKGDPDGKEGNADSPSDSRGGSPLEKRMSWTERCLCACVGARFED